MWPFKKKSSSGLNKLVFKDGQGFFDYHCKYMKTDLEPGIPLVGFVLDARKKFGAEVPVQVREDGVQNVCLQIAGKDGGFFTMALTASENGDRLKPGDVVAWLPSPMRAEKMAELVGDPRSGQIGTIVAKVVPEIDMASGQMTVVCNY